MEDTASRHTAACASVNSGGGGAGMRRVTSTSKVSVSSNSSRDLRPRFMVLPYKIWTISTAAGSGGPCPRSIFVLKARPLVIHMQTHRDQLLDDIVHVSTA